MGFQCAATGYSIGCHDVLGVLRVVCKSITSDGKTYTVNNFEELLEDGVLLELDWGEIIEIMKVEPETVELYDDVEFDPRNSGFFFGKKDPNIKIGEPHPCMQMIYITCDDNHDHSVPVPDSTLINLVNWKQKLVKQGRMKDVKFNMVINCCS